MKKKNLKKYSTLRVVEPYRDSEYLDQPESCEKCRWHGKRGDLIARDEGYSSLGVDWIPVARLTLYCPNCGKHLYN